MMDDHTPYLRFMNKAMMDKSINSLLGLIEGISIDSHINNQEITFLNEWIDQHAQVQDRHPYNELIPVLNEAIADGIFTKDEYQDIIWLCERLTSRKYYDHVTADLQRLHAVMGAILSDGRVTEEELKGLSTWLLDHEHLKIM